MARAGYTLPVFAVAAARAALLHLQGAENSPTQVKLQLGSLDSPVEEEVKIPVEQVARIDATTALGICRSDPGDNLDLTRNTPVWSWVHLSPLLLGEANLLLAGGEGVGHFADHQAAIYRYARHLFEINLGPLIPAEKQLRIMIILPEGRALAERTSNAAFGVLEGLALLGTSGIAHPIAAPDYLEESRQTLQDQVQPGGTLLFCIGSHGEMLADRLGFPMEARIRTGNWLGALLVEAGVRGAGAVQLLGYHGKLIKLAGGIFNTSSHVADARLEILAAAVVRVGGKLEVARSILDCATVDAAQGVLDQADLTTVVFNDLASRIGERSRRYVRKYAERDLRVEAILFDRRGGIVGRTGPVIR
ncbi:MAG: cobalt-precorrin-5B (C(1))-methyltransferase [Synechococcaceae cyanobacterium SM2_3_1]|nr:cobalt-precorrin-5B (C(1))-methyltransferase [Synechococcaceae cyanobacterium SM2_3_1]